MADLHTFKSCLCTRPTSVQALAAEFPLGTTFTFEGDPLVYYLLGYEEDDRLLVTPVDPAVDYAAALAAQASFDAKHARNQS